MRPYDLSVIWQIPQTPDTCPLSSHKHKKKTVKRAYVHEFEYTRRVDWAHTRGTPATRGKAKHNGYGMHGGAKAHTAGTVACRNRQNWWQKFIRAINEDGCKWRVQGIRTKKRSIERARPQTGAPGPTRGRIAGPVSSRTGGDWAKIYHPELAGDYAGRAPQREIYHAVRSDANWSLSTPNSPAP